MILLLITLSLKRKASGRATLGGGGVRRRREHMPMQRVEWLTPLGFGLEQCLDGPAMAGGAGGEREGPRRHRRGAISLHDSITIVMCNHDARGTPHLDRLNTSNRMHHWIRSNRRLEL